MERNNKLSRPVTRRSFLRSTAALASSGLVMDLHHISGKLPGGMDSDSQTAIISARVVEAETQRTTPCTVTIRTSNGTIIEDHPSFTGGFRCTGDFEKPIPPGDTTITVSKGFDYVTAERRLNARPGEHVNLVFELSRRADLGKKGWYSGDSHVHMIHGERSVVVDFAYVAMAARAAGLDYVSLAQAWNLASPTPIRLDQACREVCSEDFQLTWNMESPKNYWRGDVSHCLGHGWTLAMRGYTPAGCDVIEELDQMNAHDYETEKTPTPNFDTHALVHSQGGLVSYTHPTREWWGRWGGKGAYPAEEHKFLSNLAQELPLDTLIGPTYDTIDIMMQAGEKEVNEKSQHLWFMLLNRGYRIPGTASSDSCFDNPGGGTPGKARVYTRVEGALGLAAVAAGMKAGRNFVTSGPLVDLRIGDHQVGDIIRVDRPAHLKAALSAFASGEAGEYLTHAEVIRNGEVLETFNVEGRRTQFSSEFPVNESGTAWYIARCWGSNGSQCAITNPIYFEGKDYRKPEPVPAHVRGFVKDKQSRKLLTGKFEVIRMVGRTPSTDSEAQFENGRFSAIVHGAARIRVVVPGYASQIKSVFMDHAALLNLILNLHSEELIDWGTFEKVEALLADVPLDFELESIVSY